MLNEGRPARTADLYAEEKDVLQPFFLLTMKPTMYVANVAEHGFHDNPLLDAVDGARGEAKARRWSPVCAAMEAEIADLDGDDKLAFLADLGLTEPGLDRVIHAGYRLLGLQTYFTAGAEGSARVDRCTSARPRRRPPASSTPISRRASSAPR